VTLPRRPEFNHSVGFLGLCLHQRRARRDHRRFGALGLRDHVAGVDARDDVARLDARAFGDAEPLQAPRGLRRNRGLALRHHVTGGIQHDELLGRKRRDDRRRRHADRARLHREPCAPCDRRDRHDAEPHPAPALARANRRKIAVDSKPGEVGSGVLVHRCAKATG